MVSLDFCENIFPHTSHSYLIPSCLDCSCLKRFFLSVNLASHLLQSYLTPRCFSLICLVTLITLAPLNSHCQQFNFETIPFIDGFSISRATPQFFVSVISSFVSSKASLSIMLVIRLAELLITYSFCSCSTTLRLF